MHNSVAPSCRIPEPMLAEIFQFAIESCSSKREELALLVTLSSTSYHWRSVALNAPRLWCRVESTLGQFDAKFRLFIERSRAAPLHFTIIVEPELPAKTTTKLQTWTRALAPHLERTQTLVLRTRDQCTAKALFPFPARMPNLKAFTWYIKDRSQQIIPEGWNSPMLLDPATCGSLPESIRIVRKSLGPPLPLTWDDRALCAVKELSIEGWAGFPDHEIISLIGRCSSLKSLVWIRAVDSDDASHSEQLPILHSSTVEMLRLDLTIHDQFTSNVFKYMQFPRLKHLTIYSGDAANIELADAALLPPSTSALLTSTSTSLSSSIVTTPSTDSSVSSSVVVVEPPSVKSPYQTRFPNIETAWLSLYTFSPDRVVSFMDAHPSLQSFGCALRASFIDLIRKLSEPSSVVPWIVKAPRLTSVYVICAAFSWDGDRQPQECIEGLCEALRSLFIMRRAATASSSCGGGSGSGVGSVSPSRSGTPFGVLSLASTPSVASAGIGTPYSFGTPLSSSSSLPSLSSPPPSTSLLPPPHQTQTPQTATTTTWQAPAHIRVYLNDRSWREPEKITPEYLQLAREFPENIALSAEEDDPPYCFHHII